jgi:replicative DNA helicase
LNQCFDYWLANEPTFFALGEDVGKIGDVNQGFAGLQEKHGESRVTDTGIREMSIVGQGLGAAMRGLRPLVEIQYLDYLLFALQILSDDAATLQYRSAGGQKAPLIVRTRGHRLEGIWHSGSPMGMILHSLRGMLVLVPRNMVQAAGFYNTLMHCDEPALVVECLNGYRLKEKRPDNLHEFRVVPGHAELLDVTESLQWLAERFSMHRSSAPICGRDIAPETPLMDRAAKYLAKMDASVSGSSGHNTAWRAACAMVHGFGLAAGQALQLLGGEWNARCNPPWSQKELLHKVKQASAAPGQRGYLADATPEQWEKIVLRIGKLPAAEATDEPLEVRRTTLASAAIDYVKQLAEGSVPLIETGIPELDKALGGGVAAGEMIIVAARPSHGKSAIALQMVHHMTRRGIGAVIVSEEMSALALGKRAVQFAVDMPEREWVENHADVAEQLKDHFEQRKDAIILESCGTVERVVSEVEKAVEESKAGIVVIDYVQLLKAKGNGRYEQVTAASQEMRRLASRLNVAIVVLAQLSRKVEERKKFIPLASDLKETGQLEQDADVIILGVWPHRINAANPPEDYQFFVVKNRNRAIVSPAFQCRFEPERQRLLGPKIIELSSNYEVTDQFF